MMLIAKIYVKSGFSIELLIGPHYLDECDR